MIFRDVRLEMHYTNRWQESQLPELVSNDVIVGGGISWNIGNDYCRLLL